MNQNLTGISNWPKQAKLFIIVNFLIAKLSAKEILDKNTFGHHNSMEKW